MRTLEEYVLFVNHMRRITHDLDSMRKDFKEGTYEYDTLVQAKDAIITLTKDLTKSDVYINSSLTTVTLRKYLVEDNERGS